MAHPSPAGTSILTVIIPASNEEAYIGDCLRALLEQDTDLSPVHVIVAANGCSDRTAARAKVFQADFASRGWLLQVLDIAEGGKVNALNRSEEAADPSAPRVYLDADVLCDPALIGQLAAALSTDEPCYATGTLVVRPPASFVTRRYAAIWTRLPFVTGGAVGAGLFAVNAAGRARWAAFPDIISDDTFVRLNFAPSERIEVPARYHWPMVEGGRRLIRVRRRQDAGVAQIESLYPHLMANEGKSRVGAGLLSRLALSDPVGLAIYVGIGSATRLRQQDATWSRGR
ncbi:glycosyltransferase [Paracoccus sp. TK19116]|uniref:Glycosyltransferase n=1 Tax=Paracoccus albicereus TaxID=2922394 RepID=A0ABT1MS48_9RHOB|nr:glycosyltransferase [Paracoccus albicereus]MCQ0969706.1 glycosyltransferase [Paracoccus albicereus]